MNEDTQPWWVTGDDAAYYTDKRGNTMNLKIAHDIADKLRFRMKVYTKASDPPFTVGQEAIVILDDRITELETYTDTLRKQKEAADQRTDKADMEVGRLMVQRDELFDMCKAILRFIEGLTGYGIQNWSGVSKLRTIIAKTKGATPDKNLPKFKDLIGLFVDDAKDAALEKNPKE